MVPLKTFKRNKRKGLKETQISVSHIWLIYVMKKLSITSNFLDKLKTVDVTPVFKKEDKTAI